MAGEQADALHLVSVDARRVRVLPPEVANKIAAGEVVERPASVVKELIENSLDAGATRILVELEGAGIDLIAVVDDGEGMSAEDALCAFSRHATSKVAVVEDLERITTLGFRGEALASIAAVSRTTMVTRRPQDLAGTRLVVEGGIVTERGESGAPPGTRVEVAGLFASIPARRKFLKAPATEVGHVTEVMTRTALAFPHVSFTLRNGARTVLELPATREPADRVRQIYGHERSLGMLSFADRSPSGMVYGWLSDSQLTFPSPRQIYTYVNRRYVRDKLISHALTAGYGTLLMHGRYPAAVLFLEIPPEEVDVNVHPSKSEVRFRRGGAVHELISRAVQSRLRCPASASPPVGAAARTVAGPEPLQAAMSFAVDVPGPRSMPTLRLIDLPPPVAQGSPSARPLPVPDPHAPLSAPIRLAASAPVPREETDGDGFFASLRVIGQAFDGYLVCEHRDCLVLIDQHAAHERVTFEGLRAAYGTGTIARQQLLVSAVVELGPREAAVLSERTDELELLGFEVEAFGGTSFAVRSVPALLGDMDPAALLRDVAEELTEIGRSRRLAEAAEAVLARLACHSAVRVGQRLGLQQIRTLLGAMDRIDFAGNCPHGRPAYVRIARSELERWFRRT